MTGNDAWDMQVRTMLTFGVSGLFILEGGYT
jgi:hypothetical protein